MTGVLLITGGASGIGAETARRAARRGYKVAINYRSRDAQAMGVAADIAAQDGEAIALPGDMANEADIVRLFAETERVFGPVTHLVNSAGIGGQMRVDSYDAAALTRLFAVNVIGLMLCCREAAKRMSTRHGGKGGAIVNVSSMSARTGLPLRLPYVVSKAAVLALTTNLARELGPDGIRVNAILPGAIRGARLQRVIDAKAAALGVDLVAYERDLVRYVSLRTTVEGDDIAAMTAFLISPLARVVTGQLIAVDGNVEWEA